MWMVIFRNAYKIIFYFYYYLCLILPESWFAEPELKHIVSVDKIDITRRFAVLCEVANYDGRQIMNWLSAFMILWNLDDCYVIGGDKYNFPYIEPPMN